MNEEAAVDALAKSLAEYDGHIIVEDWSKDWELRRLEGQGTQATRGTYMREARRFLHCFQVASYLLEGYVPEEYGHGQDQ